MLPSSIHSAGHAKPQFGMLMKIHSNSPNRAFSYGQEVLGKLNGTSLEAGQSGAAEKPTSLIINPKDMADFAHSLGLHTGEDLDPQKAHGFKDPQDEKSFWIVADAPETLPHGSTYVTLKNALQSLIAKTKMSADEQVRAEANIQQNFTNQKPNFSIQV
jgi:hypothetical protein